LLTEHDLLTLSSSAGRGPVHPRPWEPDHRRRPPPIPANAAFNPGAAQVGGETVLLVRVEDLRGISSLFVARSADGIGGWQFETEPLLAPESEEHPEEIWGCEDPRLTWLESRNAWAIAYTPTAAAGRSCRWR
jgi:predicted GH43/DUF377 family glycosyl hydrolase